MNARSIFKFFEDGIATLMDLRPHTATPQQRALGDRFSSEMRALNDVRRTGEGSEFWRDTCLSLGKLADEDDPLFFMRWGPIGATMVHGATPATIRDWWRLRRTPLWWSVWAPALRHAQYGHPPPFLPMLTTNAMAIEHASHLYRFHASTGVSFYQTADCIIEFGGGFGSMCRMVHALGFRGTYIIFDLPHVLALQRYYLGLHGIEAGDGPDAGVRLCADLDGVARVLDEHGPAAVSAMSTWAMSEMPLSLRARIEPFLERPTCAKLLLTYQAKFEGNDNGAYFTALADRMQEAVTWWQLPMDKPPVDPTPTESRYLFGIRR